MKTFTVTTSIGFRFTITTAGLRIVAGQYAMLRNQRQMRSGYRETPNAAS